MGRNFPLLWALLPLIVVLLLAAWAISLVRRWRQEEQPVSLSAGEQLSHFRELYEQGELDEEEYQRIRGKLGARIRQEMNVPADPKAGPSGSAEQSSNGETDGTPSTT